MAETATLTDKSLGLSLTFSILTVLLAVMMMATSYLSFINDDGQMQIIAGLAFAGAMLTGGLAVAAFHIFSE